MDLAQITADVCKEILEKTNIQLKSKKINDWGLSPTEYYGFKPKKRFQLFYKNPIFKLNIKFGRITLTSFYKKYDNVIKEIAEKNEFGHNFENPEILTIYL